MVPMSFVVGREVEVCEKRVRDQIIYGFGDLAVIVDSNVPPSWGGEQPFREFRCIPRERIS